MKTFALSILTATCILSCGVKAGPWVPGTPAEPLLPVSISDPGIIAWATGVVSYNPGAVGDTTFQDAAAALGPAEGVSTLVTNLGRGGSIALSFDAPIADGAGADFAIFENGFSVGERVFAELAWVDVSSNGTTFVRFPGFYVPPPLSSPVGEFDTVDNTNFSGFAGKYAAGSSLYIILCNCPLFTSLGSGPRIR